MGIYFFLGFYFFIVYIIYFYQCTKVNYNIDVSLNDLCTDYDFKVIKTPDNRVIFFKQNYFYMFNDNEVKYL